MSADSIWLTHREQEVIDLIAQGQRNKEIAESFHIPACTVKRRVDNVLENLERSTSLQTAIFLRKEKSGRSES